MLRNLLLPLALLALPSVATVAHAEPSERRAHHGDEDGADEDGHGIEGIAFGHRLSGRFAEGGEKALQLLALRELEFFDHEQLRQFLGQLEEGREDDDGLLRGLGVEASVLDHAVDDRVRLGQHEMEVAQEEDGFLGEAVDGGENLGGILLAEGGSGANVDATGGARPSMEGILQLVGHAANHGLGALLLERGEVDAGITGTDFMGYGLHWLVSWQFSVFSFHFFRDTDKLVIVVGG
jgi:hypothetical protein